MNESPTQKLQEALKNPEKAAQIVDYLVRDKPVGHGHASISPYYRAEYATEIRRTIDAMMLDGKPHAFLYKDYPQYKPRTLYAKVNQSIKYLVEMMDTADHKYSKFNERLKVSAKSGFGIELSIKKLEPFQGVVVAPLTDTPAWKRKMEDWIEHSPVGGEAFHHKNLALTEGEIVEIKSSLAPLYPAIIGIVTPHEIKLIKQQ
jgi:hypothetical protein